MQAPDTRFRRWLKLWFGYDRAAKVSDQPAAQARAEDAGHLQEPVFSLSDTKQDVVVSYRAARGEK